MKDHIGVLVGTGQGGQGNILEALQDAGYYATSAGVRMWPRDHYVHMGRTYVKRGEAGMSGNLFGEGGYVRIGKGYLLIGTGIGDLVTPYSARDFLGFEGEQRRADSQS